MSLTTIRTQIKAYISSATSLNKTIYDYARFSSNLGKTQELFEEGGILHTWDIRRIGFTSNHGAGSGGVFTRIHNYVLRGYYRFNDSLASEKTFSDTTIETVLRKFEDNPKLAGECQVINQPVVGAIIDEMFMNVLCHKVEIFLDVQERRVT